MNQLEYTKCILTELKKDTDDITTQFYRERWWHHSSNPISFRLTMRGFAAFLTAGIEDRRVLFPIGMKWAISTYGKLELVMTGPYKIDKAKGIHVFNDRDEFTLLVMYGGDVSKIKELPK